METRNVGGRPEKIHMKLALRNIMKNLRVADVHLAQKEFMKITGQAANYHTIKKYLDQLTDEDFLRVQIVQDNIKNIEKGQSKTRRRVFLYQLN